MITQKTIMSNILVTGCDGQLGLELKELSENYPNFQMVFSGISKLDLTEHDAVMRYFNEKKHNNTYSLYCSDRLYL